MVETACIIRSVLIYGECIHEARGRGSRLGFSTHNIALERRRLRRGFHVKTIRCHRLLDLRAGAKTRELVDTSLQLIDLAPECIRLLALGGCKPVFQPL